MWEGTFHTHENERIVIYIWMKHSIASGTAHAVSHKKIYFLKNCSKSISQSHILVSQGHTDLGEGNSGYMW